MAGEDLSAEEKSMGVGIHRIPIRVAGRAGSGSSSRGKEVCDQGARGLDAGEGVGGRLS